MKYFLTFTISYILLAILMIVVYYLIGSYDIGLTALIIGYFLFLPFSFGLYSSCNVASSGSEINYSSLNYLRKNYYSPRFKGIFNGLLTFIIFLLIELGCLIVFSSIYSLIFYDEIASIYQTIIEQNAITSETINSIINLPYYVVIFLLSDIVSVSFFLYRLNHYALDLNLGYIYPLPYQVTKMVAKKVRKQRDPTIIKASRLLYVIYFALFIIGSALGGTIAYIYREALYNIAILEIITISSGILLSSFLIPILGLNNSFDADYLSLPFLIEVKNQIIMNNKNPSLNNDMEISMHQLLEQTVKGIDEKINSISETREKAFFTSINVSYDLVIYALNELKDDLLTRYKYTFTLLEKGEFENHLKEIESLEEEYLKQGFNDSKIIDLFSQFKKADSLLINHNK